MDENGDGKMCAVRMKVVPVFIMLLSGKILIGTLKFIMKEVAFLSF